MPGLLTFMEPPFVNLMNDIATTPDRTGERMDPIMQTRIEGVDD